MKPLDLLLAIAVPMLWGVGFTVAKHAFESFPPIFLMSLRFGIAALVLIWFVRPMWDQAPRLLFATFLGGATAYSLQFTGLSGMDASIAVLVVQIEVVFLSIFAAIVFRDRLSRGQVAAMAAACLGIVLIAGDPKIEGDPLPFALVVAGGIIWAAGQTVIKSFGNVGGLRLIAWFAAFCAPQFLVLSLVFEDGQWQAVTNASFWAWTEVFYLALVMTAGGYALWYRLVGLYRMNQLAPFVLLVPVTSIFASIVFLGEELTVRVALGGLFVLAAVAYIHLAQAKPEALRETS